MLLTLRRMLALPCAMLLRFPADAARSGARLSRRRWFRRPPR